MKNVISANMMGVSVSVQVDKNNQVCDIQPRLGMIHTTYQGRPLALCSEDIAYEMMNIIKNMSNEERKALTSGNIERNKKFKR